MHTSFFSHFSEFRIRVIKILVVFVLAAIGFYFATPRVLDFIIAPAGHLVFFNPQDAFSAYMQVTLVGGFVISLPFTVYQIWAFSVEALKEKEKSGIVIFALISLFLFLAGMCFGFWVIVPWAYQFLLSFATPRMVAMISVSEYISFVMTWVLTMGAVFELPLLMAFLASIGIASPEFLRQKRRHAIVLILIVSAVLSPPDVVSQLIVAAPLFVLFEIGIIGVKFFYKPGRDWLLDR